MMSEEMRRATRLDDTQLLKWRNGGRSQKAKTLLFVAGVSILILIGFEMLAAAPFPQYGGQRMRRPWGPDQQLARLSERLNLTDAQKAKIKPLLEEQHKQMMALRQDTSMTREERMAKFQQIHKQTFEKIHPILTSEQQKQLHQMQQMWQQRRGRGGWNQPPQAR